MRKIITRVLSLLIISVMLIGMMPLSAVAADWIPSNVKTVVFDANYYASKYADLKKAFGTNATKLYNHFITYGAKEGRQASPIFSSSYYTTKNTDLKAAFGSDYVRGLQHFGSNGYKEGGRLTAECADLGRSFEARITASSGMAVTVSGSNVELGKPVSNSDSQLWKFSRNSDGTYTIQNKNTGTVLDVAAASAASGTNVQVHKSNNTNAQRWYIFKYSGNQYILRSKATPSCVLNVSGGKSDAGTNVDSSTYNGSSAQKFTIVNKKDTFEGAEPADLGSSFYARIKGVSSGKYVTAASDGNAVIMGGSDSNAQLWKFTRRSDGSYTIVHRDSGNALHVNGGGNTASTNVRTAQVISSNAQRWMIYDMDGHYVLSAKCAPNCVLDIYANSKSDGTNVQQYTYNGTTAQLFDIVPAEPKAELYQVAPDGQMLLNCYIIKTKNDKLIVIDGGGNGYDTPNIGYLYGYLQRLSGKEVPEIEAWILTHLHDDHVNEFIMIAKDSSKKINIKNVYFNLPSKSFMEKSEKGKYAYLFDEVRAGYDKLYGAGAFDAIGGKNIFEGDSLTIDGVRLDVLMTVTDEESESNINDTSLIFKATIDGNTVMFLADTYIHEGRRLLEQYGTSLKSDVVQMAHHGQAGVERNVYEAIDADVCLWPTPVWVWDNHPGIYQTPEVRQWMRQLGVKYHYVAGVDLTQKIIFPLDYSQLKTRTP